MTEHRTETQILEDRIVAACQKIRAAWPHMMPVGPPPRRMGGGKSVGIVGDNTPPKEDDIGRPVWESDHDESTHDIDRVTHVASVRRSIRDSVNGWCRVIVEDRPVEKAIPDGLDVLAMCEFLERHAQWMGGHGAAPDMAEELEPLARAAHRIVNPPAPRETMKIGECPNHIGDDGERVVCGADIRIHPRHVGDIRCPGCGKSDTYDGWVVAMVGTQGPYTSAQLIGQLRKRLGIVATESTIRTWVEREVILPMKGEDGNVVRDAAGRSLFDIHDVVVYLSRRQRRAG